jgi:hypothetical protein
VGDLGDRGWVESVDHFRFWLLLELVVFFPFVLAFFPVVLPGIG